MRYALALMVAACGGGGSSQPNPDSAPATPTLADIRSTTTVQAGVDGQTGMAELGVFGGLDAGSATLPAGLSVTVTARGTPVTATITGTSFLATFPGAPTADEPISVAISLGADSTTSMVTMPPAFAIDSKSGTPTTPPYTVTWSPTASDVMRWQASAAAPSNHTCSVVGPTGATLTTDTGTLTIDQQISAVGPMGCYLGMTLYRTRAGTVSANAAAGSTISAEQSASML